MESLAECADDDSDSDSDGEIQLLRAVPPRSSVQSRTESGSQMELTGGHRQRGSSPTQRQLDDSARHTSCTEGGGGSPHNARNCKSDLPLIIIPRRFDGSTDWQAYKLHFLTCAESNSWSDEESFRYLRARLVGDAALSIVSSRNGSFAKQLLALDARYGVSAPDFVIKARIRQLFQEEGQSLQEYANQLSRAVSNRPGSEVEEERIVLEQFLHGMLDVKVKHYVNKRYPATLGEAVRLGRDCEAIIEWKAESSARNHSHTHVVDQLQRRVASLENEVEVLRNERSHACVGSVPASTSGKSTRVRPRTTAVYSGDTVGYVEASTTTAEQNSYSATKTAASSPPRDVMTGSSDLFSDSSMDHPPRATRPATRYRNVSSRSGRGRAEAKSRASKRSAAWSNANEPSSDNNMGAATEADLRRKEPPVSEATRQVLQTMTKSYSTADSYYVWGEVHPDVQAALFVVDTGAVVSLLNKDVYNDIPDDDKPPLRDTDMSLQSVDSSDVKCYSIANMTVNVQGHRITHDFWICDIGESGVIGMDLLKEQRALIDLAHDKLILGNKVIRVSNSAGQRVRSKIVSRVHTVIPPGREAIIQCKVYNKRQRNKPGFQPYALVEPPPTVFKKTGAVVARVVVSAREAEVPIRVFNPGDKDVHIRKFTTMGRMSTPESITCVPSKAQSLKVNEVKATPPKAADGTAVPEHVRDLYERSVKELDGEDKPKVAALLTEYADVFATSATDIGRTKLVQHVIDTGQERPVHERVRRFPYEQSKEIEQQVKTMKEQGLIQESTSQWASNVVLVKKKEGTWRMCVDYRRLNMKTKNSDPYMLPRIDETLDRLSKARYFSTLDLLSGYHQVELSPESKAKTAFIVPRMSPNHWEYRVMPFGLSGAPRTFQRLIDNLLRGLEYEIAMAYLDDIIVYALTVDQMISRLKQVLQRLRDAGLKLKAKKCSLFQTETIYLGHVISRAGVSCDPEKVRAVQQWVEPRTVRQVRSFLGTVGYYRRFIRNYSDIARPLYNLTKKKHKFMWTVDCSQAFQTLKRKLLCAPIMSYPQDKGLYVLDTDASGYAIGGVLSQMQEDDNGVEQEKVIAYASRILHPRETRYCVRRREMLAIVHFVKHFRPYLWGRKVLIRTDHASLRYVKTMKEPSDQFHRWIEKLDELEEYTIEVRKGANHGNADGLSRMSCGQNKCICDPVHQLELRRGGADNHEIVYADSRTENEDSEKYLELQTNAEVGLDDRIKAKPRKKCRPRQVNFDKAARGVTDSEMEAIPGLTDVHSCVASSSARSSGKKQQKRTGRHEYSQQYDSRCESSDTQCEERQPVKATVRQVKVQTATQGTQTGDEVHQRHDRREQTVFARAVALGTLWSKEEMAQAQLEDADIAPVVKALSESKDKPGSAELQGNTQAARFYFLYWNRLVLIDGVLHIRWESADMRRAWHRLVLPFKYRDVVMVHLHDSNYAGHLGGRRTQVRVNQRYFWYKMYDDIARYLRTCDTCQRRKRPGRTPHAPMVTRQVGVPFERIAMDICGKMVKTHEGNEYVLVISDYFSKYTIAVPMKDKSSRSVAEALCTHWVSFFGMPDIIHTDRGGEFENNVLRELCERFGTLKTKTVAYNPRSDGQVERWNATFTQIVNTICEDKEEWDEYLAFARMAYNSTVHATTGETPNMIVMGRQIRLPLDVMTDISPRYDQLAHSEYVRALEEDMRECFIRVRDRARRSAQCQKSFYDRRRNENVYRSEDLVMLKTMVFQPHLKKLQDRYTGPWAVIEALSGNCYRIQKSEFSKPEIVHHDRLKPYRARNPEEHDTDWVARVRDRLAAIRSQEPLPPVMPSTGEETDMCDLEEELVLNVRPEDTNIDSSADDELTEDDAEESATGGLSTGVRQPATTGTAAEPGVCSKHDSSSSITQSDDEVRSVEEYSVPRFNMSSLDRGSVQRSDSSSAESVNLAESQFMFKELTPRYSQRYGLRKRPKPKQIYSP